MLGAQLIGDGLNVVSGFGTGIGGRVIVGAMNELGTNDEQRLVLRPFPQDQSKAYWKSYREKMISKAGFSVFLCGNKNDKGAVVQADAVLEECEITKKLGKYPIPVGATGHAAETIWKDVTANIKAFFPNESVASEFKTLGSAKSSDSQLVDAVTSVIKKYGLG